MHAPLDLAFRTEWRSLAELAAIRSDWQALAERAIEPNVFYEPSFALAAAPVLGAGAGALLIWSKSDQLVGFFPARIERRYGLFPRVLCGWVHPYAPLGLPLVDRNLAEPVIAAWLDHLAHEDSTPAVLLITFLPEEGPFAAAFDRVIALRGTKTARFGRHARAFFAPGDGRDDYLQRSIAPKNRKELSRKRRRMEEAGFLTREAVTAPSAIGAALADFFALEASGWKGRAGTAAMMRADIRDFIEKAVTGLSAHGQARADLVRVDGKLIAATLILQSGDTVWGWKIAYDEDYARFSPAVQLVFDLTQTLLDNKDIRRADSCATPDHPMIDHIWRERLPIADCMIALRPGPAFWLACRFETTRRSAIAAAKRLRDALKRKKPKP
jgi:CelD/BcsL family acetyltransferase involved in cellulose biosynthesis